MELRQYWQVIWKRRWLVLGIIGLVTVFSLVVALTAHKIYGGDLHFTARQVPVPLVPGSGAFVYDNYYNKLASEFLVDDYVQIVETDAFGRSVLDVMRSEAAAGKPSEVKDMSKLKTMIGKLKPQDLVDATGADRRARELRVFAVTDDPDLTLAMINAIGMVITQGQIEPYRGTVQDKPMFGQMDEVSKARIESNTGKDIVNAVTRIIIGIVIALALAFLLEYLDRSVRDERDARQVLEVPVLGTIPRV